MVAPQALNFWDEDPETGLALLRPDRSIVGHPWGHEVRSNEAGFRDEAWRMPAGTPRILVFGDSFIEAIQVGWTDSFVPRLETDLREGGRTDAEVVSAAISGWGTDAHLRYFETRGRELAADVVVVMFTLYNDVQDNAQGEYHDWVDGRLIPRNAARTGMDRRINALKRAFAGRSHLYQLTRNIVRSGQTGAQFAALEDHWLELVSVPAEPAVEQAWQRTEAMLTALSDSVRSTGGELVLVPIPMEIAVSPAHEASFLENTGATAHSVDLDHPQARLEAWAADRGVRVIDLAVPFRDAYAEGELLYLATDGHWNEKGHEVAARVVAAELNVSDHPPERP